ncbi:hypothetical protein C0992_002411 [Termitomyces sp. T32_za158]|nr:hypothetical protein C0992_002411 [Termitomyces sp. T32_za158]
MLFCTSLLALVGAADQPQSSPRKLQIVNTKVRPRLTRLFPTHPSPQRQSMICELLFPSSVLAVKMNRKTLVVVLELEIYIYDISNMRLMHVIETLKNPDAICALSPSADNSYLAYPAPLPSPTSLPPASSSSTSNPNPPPPPAPTGDVLLFSTRSLSVANVLRAHKSPIALLSLNPTGTLLASASDKGTVIRVFSVPNAEKLYQFRRGTRETRIYSLAFNRVSSLLAVSSAHETVHVFKLGLGAQRPEQQQRPESPASIPPESDPVDDAYDVPPEKKPATGFISSTLRRKSLQMTKSLSHSVGTYLPNTLTELWEPARDFAFLRLPPPASAPVGGGAAPGRCVVAISP